MKTNSIISKIVASVLSLSIVGGVCAASPVSSMIGTSVTVSAASEPTVIINGFTYNLKKDGTASVVGYSGTKDLSTSVLSMPSVIYSSDIDIDWNNWEEYKYIGSYKVTKLQASIFSGSKIKLLYLPSYLEAVMGGFIGAEIGGFAISTSNSYFSTNNSISALYNKSGTTLYAYPSKQELYTTSYGSDVVFNTGITRVEDQAFANCKSKTVKFPETVTYLGDRVFRGSSIMVVTFLGNSPSFRFMPSDTHPDHGTFDGALSLQRVLINGTNGSYNSDEYGLIYNKDKTKLILVPRGIKNAFYLEKTCTEIGAYAFMYNNTNGVTIYSEVQTISDNAFSEIGSGFKLYCLKDTPIERFAKTKNIPYSYAFEYSENSSGGVTFTKYNGPFTYFYMPEAVNGKEITEVGETAFYNNTAVLGVYMYNNVNTIGKYAFGNCTNLSYVRFPNTLKTINSFAFYNCKKLDNIPFTSSIETIGPSAFAHCTSITSVKIPASVKKVDYNAFYNCTSLNSLTLNSGTETIGSSAFESTALTSQYIPASVTVVNPYAFGYYYDSENKKHIRKAEFTKISGYPDTAAEKYAATYNIPFDSFLEYKLTDDGTGVIITKFTGNDTVYTIPSKIAGKPVVGIDKLAFFYAPNLATVTIPDTVKEIGMRAFYKCLKLKVVNFPDTVVTIGTEAFRFCENLTTINFPDSLRTIGPYAFFGCKLLKSIKLNTGLKAIGLSAFVNTNVRSFTIPRSVTSLGYHSFGYTNDNDGDREMEGDVVMVGYAYTAADDYAKDNPFITFIPQYDNIQNSSTISTISTSVGETVKIHASSYGGKRPIRYTILYTNNTDGTRVTIQEMSDNTEAEFTPQTKGNYTVTVKAYENRGYCSVRDFTVQVYPALVNKSTVSKTVIYCGESITVTGKASGGKTPYNYGVYYKKTNENSWHTLRAYDSSATVTFKPEEVSKYDLCVKVKDDNGTIEKKYFTITVKKPLTNESVISESKITLGESVIVTCKASGGKTPYTYAVYYKRTDETSWHTLKDYSTTAKATFKPEKISKYDICVKVKGAENTIDRKYMTLNVTNDLKDISVISASSVNVKEKVTVTCKGIGGTKPYTFAVYYKKTSETSWHTLKDFNTTAKAEFVPDKTGTYDLCTKVRDAKKTIAKQYFKVTAVNPLTNKSTVSSVTVKKGNSITVTCKSAGGTTPYNYAVLYKKTSESNWKVLKNYSTTSTAKFTPDAAAKYDLCVKVKDKTDTIDKKYFTITATS